MHGQHGHGCQTGYISCPLIWSSAKIQGWANICTALGTDFQGPCGLSAKPVQSPCRTVLQIKSMTTSATQQIRCPRPRYTKWRMNENGRWRWAHLRFLSSRLLKMLKQLSALIRPDRWPCASEFPQLIRWPPGGQPETQTIASVRPKGLLSATVCSATFLLKWMYTE